MKTTTLNDHLIQLTRYSFVNAYLLRHGSLDDASLRRSMLRDKRLTL